MAKERMCEKEIGFMSSDRATHKQAALLVWGEKGITECRCYFVNYNVNKVGKARTRKHFGAFA
jgi:hypothetical protein